MIVACDQPSGPENRDLSPRVRSPTCNHQNSLDQVLHRRCEILRRVVGTDLLTKNFQGSILCHCVYETRGIEGSSNIPVEKVRCICFQNSPLTALSKGASLGQLMTDDDRMSQTTSLSLAAQLTPCWLVRMIPYVLSNSYLKSMSLVPTTRMYTTVKSLTTRGRRDTEKRQKRHREEAEERQKRGRREAEESPFISLSHGQLSRKLLLSIPAWPIKKLIARVYAQRSWEISDLKNRLPCYK